MSREALLRRPVLATVLGTVLVLGMPAATGGAAPVVVEESVPSPAPTDPAAGIAASPAPTAQPSADVAVAAPAALGERTLRFGDSGGDVTTLQKLLRVRRTGTFDAATRKAVRSVQRAAGLRTTGVVTARTLKAIKRADAQRRRAAAREATARSLPRAGAPAASKRYAAAYIARQYGWGSGQMSCLSALWTRESGWRYWVSNPNGIYRGIPQTSARVWGSMGYTTAQYMRSPEIQIKVGTRYIRSRYGTPCNAWAFWRSHHWY